MSDIDLLLFGCVVSFIAVAGAYVYIRESFTEVEPTTKPEAKAEEAAPTDLREVA